MESYQIADLLTTIVVAGSLLTALGIVSRAWAARRRGVPPTEEMARLAESVDRLQLGVERMQEALFDLGERMEFTERALTQLAEVRKAQPKLPEP